MPGVLHQGILSLIRDDPWLPFDVRGREHPVKGTPVDRRADLDHPTDDPEKVKMRHADLVLVARDPDNSDHGVVIDVEAQRKRSQSKRRRIAGYLGKLEDEHDLPSMLVLVSFSRALSQEAQTWGTGPGLCFDTLVLDVDNVPIPTSIEAALERPTAAVLAGALHGCRGNLDAARMGIAACRGLPEKRRESYIATILAAVPERWRKQLMEETNVTLIREDELWEIERRSGAYQTGLKAGRAEGRRTTLVELIVTVLEVRGFQLDAEIEARIRSCESLATLQVWARRAREVTRPDELFESD